MNDPRHTTPAPNHAHGLGQQPQHRPQVAGFASPHAPAARPGIAPMPVQPRHEEALDPIELVEDEVEPSPMPNVVGAAGPATASPAVTKSKIKFGAEIVRREHQWKRQPHASGQGVCRVKSFHGKYSDQGLEHMDDMINEWLDAHPEVEVKFVTSTVNVFEGKIREPALVLNLWY